jgi:copper chaperone
MKLKIPNMACGACAKTITQAVIDLDPKATVKADPKTKQVIVDTKVSESSVKDAIAKRGASAIAAAGYPPA